MYVRGGPVSSTSGVVIKLRGVIIKNVSKFSMEVIEHIKKRRESY